MNRAMAAARVVLASSRTIEEILELETRLGVATDFIAENGAQLVVRDEELALTLGDSVTERHAARPLFVTHFAAPLDAVVPVAAAAAPRDVPGVTTEDDTRPPGQLVPDAGTRAIGGRRAFDLKG